MNSENAKTKTLVHPDCYPCPGGFGCTCCGDGCDCGCVDECPVFKRHQRQQFGHQKQPASGARLRAQLASLKRET